MNPIIIEMTKSKTFEAYVEGNPSVREAGDTESIAVAKLLLRLQGVRPSNISGAFLLSGFCWLGWFALSWLFMADAIRLDTFSGMMWGLFLLIGILAGAFATRK